MVLWLPMDIHIITIDHIIFMEEGIFMEVFIVMDIIIMGIKDTGTDTILTGDIDTIMEDVIEQ